MLYLTRKSITKGVVHFTPNAVYTLSEILNKEIFSSGGDTLAGGKDHLYKIYLGNLNTSNL